MSGKEETATVLGSLGASFRVAIVLGSETGQLLRKLMRSSKQGRAEAVEVAEGEGPRRTLNDESQSSLSTNEELSKIRTDRGFLGALTSLDDLAVCKDDCEVQDVLSHRSVANSVGSARARSNHAANLSAGCRVDGEEERDALLLESKVESFVANSRLHDYVEVIG